MTVDLKIAEALGIPIYKGTRDWVRDRCTKPALVYYSRGNISWWTYMMSDNTPDGVTASFTFDLTGPDAGNTRDVIETALVRAGWTIEYSIDSEKKTGVSIWKFIPPDDIDDYHGDAKTPCLSLREAAAKALKVEVEG